MLNHTTAILQGKKKTPKLYASSLNYGDLLNNARMDAIADGRHFTSGKPSLYCRTASLLYYRCQEFLLFLDVAMLLFLPCHLSVSAAP